MATVVQAGPDGIIYKAADTRKIPQLDLLTILFESPYSGSREETVLHADAADTSKRVNKRDLRQVIKRTAYTLRNSFGIGRDGPNQDVVLCISTGHFMLPALFFGIIGAGGIYSAASPAATASELAAQIQLIDAKLILCNTDTVSIAKEAAGKLSYPLSRVLCLGAGHDLSLHEAESGLLVPILRSMLDWRKVTDPDELANSVICILFSSGTTGFPKGVKLSHSNMVAEAFLTIEAAKEHYARTNPSFEFRTLAHLPTAHIAGVQGYFINPQYYGGTVYWMTRFDFQKFLDYNKKYRVTMFFSVPPIYLAIAKHPGVTNQFDSLDHAISGAAPLGREVQTAAQRKLGRGKAVLAQTWGLSETTGSITALPRDMRDETGSVSMLIANSEARIVDDEGRDVEPGQSGEIWVKSPVVTKGYWNNEHANRQGFADGWFCTGDIGLFRGGKFYIVDRKKVGLFKLYQGCSSYTKVVHRNKVLTATFKELIKYKGMQVAPAELEALLLSHPNIQDCAVIGVEKNETEVPRAYIVSETKGFSAKEVADWVAKQVADHKKLRGGVTFIEYIPRSPAGKILRKILREKAFAEKASRL